MNAVKQTDHKVIIEKHNGPNGVRILKESLDTKNGENLRAIRTKQFTIKDSVIEKFQNQNKRKIIELIEIFLKQGEIFFKTEETAVIKMKMYDFTLLVNFKKRVIENIFLNEPDDIPKDCIAYKKGIPHIIEKVDNVEKAPFNKQEFLNQINMLRSETVNLKKTISFIKEGDFEVKNINHQYNFFILRIKDASFKISSFFIESCIAKNPEYTKAEPVVYQGLPESVKENLSKEYLSEIKILDLYKTKEKAAKYLERFGLSVKVISRFILDHNEKELHQFLISDIINQGMLYYDNFMKNEMIIQTTRFTYLIKNSVIINIKTLSMEDIPLCSIPFKRFIHKPVRKDKILNLEIGDCVKDFISRKMVDELMITDHATDRYKERISKDFDKSSVELDIKNDIYKNGEVIFGTYYKNTKLIQGYRNIYVIDNARIISVWEYVENPNSPKEMFKSVMEEFETDSEDII